MKSLLIILATSLVTIACSSQTEPKAVITHEDSTVVETVEVDTGSITDTDTTTHEIADLRATPEFDFSSTKILSFTLDINNDSDTILFYRLCTPQADADKPASCILNGSSKKGFDMEFDIANDVTVLVLETYTVLNNTVIQDPNRTWSADSGYEWLVDIQL